MKSVRNDEAVIANQFSDWCGNPHPHWDVPIPEHFRENGFPRQCCWLGMTALFFNFARNDISAFQLPPEKSGGGFCYALVALGQGSVVFSQQEHDAAHQVSLGENGAGRP